MRRHQLLACLALALAAPLPLAAERHTVQFHAGGRKLGLSVVAGKVRAVSSNTGKRDWITPKAGSKGPVSIRAFDYPGYRGWYLAYDPQGKGGEAAVFLTREPGPGTDWLVSPVEGEFDLYTIRAASGKVKGWYLDFEAGGEGYVDGKGKKATSHRVFLSHKPRRLPTLEIFVISP